MVKECKCGLCTDLKNEKEDFGLGCGKEITHGICGIANAWGHDPLCDKCKAKMKESW